MLLYNVGSEGAHLVTNATFIHNTKLTSSKINMDKKINRGIIHLQERAVTHMETFNVMPKHREAFTELVFVAITSTSL